MPPFTVDGIANVTLQNGVTTSSELYLSVNYRDSSQQTVTLSLSGLPAGIAMDTSWTTSGIPSFNSTLIFYDTTLAGATPGTYPLILTAASATTQKLLNLTLL